MVVKRIINIFSIWKNRGFFILIKSIYGYLNLLINRNILKREYIKCNVNNYKMELFTNDNGISRSLILFGTREVDKQYILKKILKKGMPVFDVGCNIGYYSIFIKKITDGNLLAIEPSIENLNLCKKNLMINGLDKSNNFLLNGAVSDKENTKNLYIANQTNLHTLNPEGSAKKFLSGEIRKVKTYSIYGLSKMFFTPGLIRMDVEGHECEIISGMLAHIKSRSLRPHICFEPHITSYSKNNDFPRILTKLFKHGYYTNLISSNSESGTKRIKKLTSRDLLINLESDGEKRGIFEKINEEDTIKILTKIGGARTVLLSPKDL